MDYLIKECGINILIFLAVDQKIWYGYEAIIRFVTLNLNEQF